jgi:hypothetical protein
MIRRYGSNAEMEATERADDLLERGDIESAVAWKRIMAAIETLQAEKPAAGETVQ